MKCQNYFIVFVMFFCLTSIMLNNNLLAQSNIKIKEKEEAPLLFDTYQLFLEFELKSIEKLEYEKSGKPLKGYLDSDKTSIVLENYDGKSRVKVTGKDFNGQVHEIKKGSCFIDPYVEL